MTGLLLEISSSRQLFSSNNTYRRILNSGVTLHYVIDQSMISISDMKKILGGEDKQNSLGST